MRSYLQLGILIAIVVVAIFRWVRFFKLKKEGKQLTYKRWEAIATFILIIAYVLVTFLVKDPIK